VVEHAPADINVRVYTAAAAHAASAHYLALRSIGVPIPWYSEMHMYVPRLRAYLRQAVRDQIQVVHLTTPGPVGLAALYVASKLGLPLVGSFHTDLAAYTSLLSGSPRLGALMRDYMRWLYNRCQRVLVPSDNTRQMLTAAKCDASKLMIWPRGVDTQLFSPSRRSRRLRDSWHVSDKRPALLYVGRLSSEKGLGMLPAVQRCLHARGMQHRWILAGQGALRPQLERTLWDAVFTGALDRDRVAEVFASVDVFVFPSRTDTAGNVVLEAQAAGLPVVVAAAGGPKENMIDGRTGHVCETTDPEEWAAAVGGMLADPARHRAMSAAAREYAIGRRWDLALAPLYDAYRAMVTVNVELQVSHPQLIHP
jgi:glycosyltransferase involved in cell wall biosynthesis